ncbi:hypothetical protein VWY34_14390 [Phaeobacter sp. JH20_02]|uniref:hypothetical protein n=1 Tax=unclassified Phaeobacter TaxID=2621772 RepID=UPI003A867F7A
MTDLIKAADALAEEIEIRLENGCEICNGDCSVANPPVQSCPQQRRLQRLTAYRQARESADGVKVARKAMGLMLEGIRKGGLDTEMGHHLIDDIFYPAIDSYIKAALED